MSDTKIVAISKPLRLGEGPHWVADQGALYYVDILGEAFHKYVPASEETTTCKLPGGTVSLVVPVAGSTDKFVVSHGRKLIVVTWDGKSTSPSNIVDLSEVDTEGDAIRNRLNDGKCDPFGRLYGGTMGPEPKIGEIEKEKGSLFRWVGKSKETLLEKVSIANGLAWDLKNRRMYYIDSCTYRVDQFDYDPDTGDICNRKAVFDFKTNQIPGLPDGMCIDTEGKLWVACFNGGRVIRIDPIKGKLMETIPLSAKQTTSVAFGGPKMDILYVTSAALEEEANNPDAGKVFKITGVKATGLPGVSMKL